MGCTAWTEECVFMVVVVVDLSCKIRLIDGDEPLTRLSFWMRRRYEGVRTYQSMSFRLDLKLDSNAQRTQASSYTGQPHDSKPCIPPCNCRKVAENV